MREFPRRSFWLGSAMQLHVPSKVPAWGLQSPFDEDFAMTQHFFQTGWKQLSNQIDSNL